MRVVLLAGVLAVAGCATQPQMPREERAKLVSDAAVCEGVFYGPPDTAAVGRNEAARRGINCMDYQQAAATLYQQRAARQQAADNAMGNLSRQLLTPAPPMPAYQIPRPVNCQSYRLGNTIQTNCN